VSLAHLHVIERRTPKMVFDDLIGEGLPQRVHIAVMDRQNEVLKLLVVLKVGVQRGKIGRSSTVASSAASGTGAQCGEGGSQRAVLLRKW
jgi:hypothetical protein